jgi:hypothetical protein
MAQVVETVAFKIKLLVIHSFNRYILNIYYIKDSRNKVMNDVRFLFKSS